MNYIREIIGLLGYDSFIKGRAYPCSYIGRPTTKFENGRYSHNFKVKSQYSENKYYMVNIINNGDKLYKFTCECQQFDKSNTCKHVSAVLYNHLDYILEHEHVDKVAISNDILDMFLTNNSNKIKKRINIDISFDILERYVNLKLKVGETTLYNLSSENKLLEFINAFKNKESYYFGKKFTYDPQIHYFDQIDEDILRFINSYRRSENYYYYKTNPFTLSYREFESFLKIYKDKEITINNLGILKNVAYTIPTKYKLIKGDENYNLVIDDIENYIFFEDTYKYIGYNHTLCILNDNEIKLLKLLQRNKLNELTFTKDSINKFSNGLFQKIKNNIVIDENIDELQIPVKPSVNLYFDISSILECNITFDYNGKRVDYLEKSDILRDNDIENQTVEDILSYGMIEKGNKFVIENEDLMYDFIDNGLNELSTKYNIFTSEKLKDTKILKKSSTSSNFSIGKDGILSFDFSIDGINKNEINGIFKALRKNKKYYKLKNNTVLSLENNDELEQLNDMFDDLDLDDNDIKGDIILPKYRALYIDSLKNTKYKGIKTNNLFDEFINNFKKYKNLEIEFNDFDNNILRDYQKDGVKWLSTIYKCDLGGILADEMGLGKTIQTISFIKQILKEKNDAKIIIISPTSLIYNWQKEFEKFGESIKYTVVAESKKHRKDILKDKEKYNVFITTYGLIRNDNDEYEDMNFEVCIIDEAQMIKNYQAGMSKEVKKIKSKCKIALTGTPIENNVLELWSIFDYIMPGYLNSVVRFRKKYSISDVKESDLKLMSNLNSLIKPFILRRKKIDVAKSLPDKIENKIYVDLPRNQKMLYLKEVEDTKASMENTISMDGFAKSRVKILQLLTRLRQLCIDPSVLYENYDYENIKMETLLNIVKENIDNGHKILIFSSFKRVLENVKKTFNNNSISSYMIDGSVSSKERIQLVDAFNKDNTNCFLITLKSGGTGLNLVGADVVIHLDIWWNPASENQATDRAHRIGQTKNVNVIKIICKGTIEEKIIQLQDKKRILSENLIEGNEEMVLSSLSEKDIRNLLDGSK